MLMHRPQTLQLGFGSITLLQKLTPPPPISKSWIRACSPPQMVQGYVSTSSLHYHYNTLKKRARF